MEDIKQNVKVVNMTREAHHQILWGDLVQSEFSQAICLQLILILLS